uniref:(California timema) hypothetical protein n=1 Tax=Timema californicum TaxID=61474 RepID=A0A7R9JFJ7_TIMCA|nr:unnamed protein product [Timema californicum]
MVNPNLELERKPQPNFGLWKSFLRFLWNPEKRTILSRTKKDWGLCIVYYIMFLGTLSALFAALMYIALFNINQMDTPWYQLEMSIIGASPGLGFWPAVRMSSPLIWYKWNEREMTYHTYVTKINDIFDGYRPYNPDIYRHCYEGYKSNESDKICFFNLETLGHCYEPQYGYDTQMPCVYLTLNQVYRWEPRCYAWDTLPRNFPEYLKEYISEKHSKETKRDHVWVSCAGVHEADSQHMGDISFHPYPGFPAEFYPYLHQDGYMSPLVAIKFNNPAREYSVEVLVDNRPKTARMV